MATVFFFSFGDHLILRFPQEAAPILLRKLQELPHLLSHIKVAVSSHDFITIIPLPSKHNCLSSFQIPSILVSCGQLPKLFLFILASPNYCSPLASFLLISRIIPEVSSGLRLLSLLGLPRALSSLLFLWQDRCSAYSNPYFSSLTSYSVA